jgi:hypothetical protein
LTAEFGMGSGLIAPQKSPGRRKAERKQTFLGRVSIRVTRTIQVGQGLLRFRPCSVAPTSNTWTSSNESVQANRAISTGKLHTLLCFHTRPINVVVFHGSRGRTRLEAGFPLRCLQRLSVPYIATLHRGWRHDRSTRGTFTPVLSY